MTEALGSAKPIGAGVSPAPRPSDSLAKNSVISGIAAIATNLAGFLSTVIVARLVGVEGTGVVSFAAAIATITIAVFDLGIQTTLTRFVPEVEINSGEGRAQDLVWYLMRIFVALNLVLFLGLVGIGIYLALVEGHAANWITADNFRSNPLFWSILGAFCLIQAMAFFETAYLKGRQRFRLLSLISLVSMAAQLTGVLVATALYGVTGALLGAFLGPAYLALRALRHRPRPRAPAPELRTRVLRFSAYTLAGQVLATLMTTRLEVVFLDAFWGSHPVGLFTVSLTLANMACVPMFLCTALLPHVSSFTGDEASTRLNETYRYSMRLLALIVLPGCFGLAAITPGFLPAIYGREFSDAVPSAMLLITFSACITMSTVPTTFLLAREESRLVMMTSAIGAALTIASGLTLIPFLGTIGGAAGRATMHAAVLASALYLLSSRLGCRPPISDLARILLAAMLCGSAALAIVLQWPGWLGIGFAIVAGVVTYGLALRLLGALKPEDAARLNRALGLLPGGLRAPGYWLFGLLTARTALNGEVVH
ncbi:MAG: oligosaccharide flippase family protein [Hyphomicrobiaceae bacterium]